MHNSNRSAGAAQYQSCRMHQGAQSRKHCSVSAAGSMYLAREIARRAHAGVVVRGLAANA